MSIGKLKRDVLINVTFALIKAVAQMFVLRIATLLLVPAELGLFLLSRRNASTWANLVQLGMSQTLLRYTSMTDDPKDKRAYTWFALLVWVGLVAICIPLFYFGRDLIKGVLLSETEGDGWLAFWAGMLLLASVVDFIVHAPLISARRMITANLVELMNVSGFMLIPLLLAGSFATPTGTLKYQSLGMIALSLAVLLVYLGKPSFPLFRDREALADIGKTFVTYGLPRGAITFLDMLILLIGPWLLRSQIAESGYLIIALTLVRLVQTGLKPIMEIASVVTARFTKADDDRAIGEGVKLWVGAIFYSTMLASAVLWAWSPALIRVWLSDAQAAQGVLRYFAVLVFGIMPFSIFHGLKGIVEMRWFKPYNFYTLVVGAVVQLLTYLVLRPRLGLDAVAISMTVCFWAMGAMTIFWIRGFLRPVSYFGVWRLLILSSGIAALNLWAVHNGAWPVAVAALLLSAVAAGVLLFVFPSPFVRTFRAFILRNKAPGSNSGPAGQPGEVTL